MQIVCSYPPWHRGGGGQPRPGSAGERRQSCRDCSGEKKTPHLSYFFGNTTLNFVTGNYKKIAKTSAKGKKKKSKRTGRHICSVRAVVSTTRQRSCADRMLLSAVASWRRRTAATGLCSRETLVVSTLLRQRDRSSTWSKSSGARRRRPFQNSKLTFSKNKSLRIGTKSSELPATKVCASARGQVSCRQGCATRTQNDGCG